MKNVITVLAYKPNNVDTCRGCVMDSFNSNFEFAVFEDVDEAAKFMFDLQVSSNYQAFEANHEFEILVNGRTGGCVDEDGFWTEFPEISLVLSKLKEMKDNSEREENKKKLAAKIAFEKAQKVAEEQRKIEEANRELEEYERLKKKFA